MDAAQRHKLADLVIGRVTWDCPLDRYTSLAIGGPAEAVVVVESRPRLQPLLRFLEGENIAWRVIGRGTNLLVSDAGFAGVIVVLGGEFEKSREISAGEGKAVIAAGGGCGLARLSLDCASRGLAGLEFACGIPGTVGGAVIMNAGAWGEDMAGVVHSVTVVTPEGEETLLRSRLDFRYRAWPGFVRYRGRAVVIAVELSLARGDSAALTNKCRQLQARRRKTQPPGRSAGSFFKNPEGDSAGRLIEASGLKGIRVGGAMISERHGNFLINTGNATAGDVLRLMRLVQEKVAEDCGITLEPEVHFV